MQRNIAEEVNPVGFALAHHALGAEDVGALVAVRAREYGHVLDHAQDLFPVSVSGGYLGGGVAAYRHVDFAEHGDAFDGVFESDVLRGGYNDCSCGTVSGRRNGREWAFVPSSLICCVMVNCVSPVPGGRSRTSTSRPPQSTSCSSCCKAFITIRPRHTTGAFSSTKKPIDIALTP